ncbi:NAD dependent epimerase/dehydratase [Colletotrichum higginsianum IMI 349063]|uniref:NAD dependent epimerase/dehydratase n=1 Tax=Colletotrichum higginsianum (strain IMI 349063) TaxID=759273 RepID=A0A1B7YW73_COLHI|nr:NAD dependent epimerase/dehydratase [Colletotrichum higginsianum IMI 349063]OBR16296.1 NAD dependent epimerase/dehydratase [Colletotrichum higginsianum IMI 349063]GJC91459.1 NAD dependent epimerase/dehydratase [Colletotrichum higginsianum]
MSTAASLRRDGIYRNLPTFDDSVTGLTAIITGANGISGFNTMRALLSSPERWTKIYALSRSPPPEPMMALLSPEARSRVEVVTCDFLKDAETLGETFKRAGVRHADHVFFYSYIHKDWSEAEALVESNAALLENFLGALEIAGVRPARFVLQTGGKNYGMHIGRVRTPVVESDPQPRHLQPNFYYPQEDLLRAFCERNGVSWNVIRPAAVIGTSMHAGMNTFYPFAVYAIVQARKGEPIAFGGDWEQWQFEFYHCSATMTGYLTEWAVLQEDCANEAFNAQDGGPLSWERYFSELARWFGAEGVVPPPDDESNLKTIEGKRGKDTPLGYGPPLSAKQSFSLFDWAKDDKNAAVWREVMEESGGKITEDPFKDPEFFLTSNFAYTRFGSLCLNKARRFGWTGFVDTTESIFEMYQEMEKLGMLPAMEVPSARPLC